jgi:hypothetical protein
MLLVGLTAASPASAQTPPPEAETLPPPAWLERYVALPAVEDGCMPLTRGRAPDRRTVQRGRLRYRIIDEPRWAEPSALHHACHEELVASRSRRGHAALLATGGLARAPDSATDLDAFRTTQAGNPLIGFSMPLWHDWRVRRSAFSLGVGGLLDISRNPYDSVAAFGSVAMDLRQVLGANVEWPTLVLHAGVGWRPLGTINGAAMGIRPSNRPATTDNPGSTGNTGNTGNTGDPTSLLWDDDANKLHPMVQALLGMRLGPVQTVIMVRWAPMVDPDTVDPLGQFSAVRVGVGVDVFATMSRLIEREVLARGEGSGRRRR